MKFLKIKQNAKTVFDTETAKFDIPAFISLHKKKFFIKDSLIFCAVFLVFVPPFPPNFYNNDKLVTFLR